MSSIKPNNQTTAADYLYEQQAKPQALKQEFVNGYVYPKADPSRNHDWLTTNFAGLLFMQLRASRRCRISQSMKLRIQTLHEDYFYYPDLQVSCAPEVNQYYNNSPCLIVEVLSPETARIDRSEKLNAYCLLPSLQEYVLCSQDSPNVELYRRENNWELEYFNAGETLPLDSIKATLKIADLYEFILDEPNEV